MKGKRRRIKYLNFSQTSKVEFYYSSSGKSRFNDLKQQSVSVDYTVCIHHAAGQYNKYVQWLWVIKFEMYIHLSDILSYCICKLEFLESPYLCIYLLKSFLLFCNRKTSTDHLLSKCIHNGEFKQIQTCGKSKSCKTTQVCFGPVSV